MIEKNEESCNRACQANRYFCREIRLITPVVIVVSHHYIYVSDQNFIQSTNFPHIGAKHLE